MATELLREDWTECFRRAAAGDSSARERIWRRLNLFVRSCVRRNCRRLEMPVDERDVEEIASICWEAEWAAPADRPPPEHPLSWLKSLVAHKCDDFKARRARESSNISLDELIETEAERIVLDAAPNPLVSLLHEGIRQKLNSKEQLAVFHFFHEEMTLQQVARAMGISIAQTRYLIHASVAKLRAFIETQNASFRKIF